MKNLPAIMEAVYRPLSRSRHFGFEMGLDGHKQYARHR